MKELIGKISLRARVAFIILCIENALRSEDTLVKWNKVLELFWSQTSMQFVDEWLYEISKVMPESILEDDYEENETISFAEYSKIKSIYKSTPKYIFELMEFAFECGTIDLYGAVEENSNKTIQSVLKCIEIMKEKNIELPKIELLEKFSISENGGWGNQFTREEILDENN
jgi:hypothetical protein